MRDLTRQTGMSFLGILVIAMMVGFFVMCGIKMFPHYMEYLTVRDVVAKIATEPGSEESGVAAIRRRLDSNFNTNQIYGLDPREVLVFREDGEVHINANYESRIKLFGNIDVVMRHEDLDYILGQPKL